MGRLADARRPLTVTDKVEILDRRTDPFERLTELIGTGAAQRGERGERG